MRIPKKTKLYTKCVFLFASLMLSSISLSASEIVPDDDKPFITVDKMPQYTGGDEAMNKFIGENLEYPQEAFDKGIQGRVTVRFVVSKTGKVDDVVVLRGIDPQCDAEAVRVIKAMPNWIPGKNNGRPVAVYFSIPFVFRIPLEEPQKKVDLSLSETHLFVIYSSVVSQKEFVERLKFMRDGSYKMFVKRVKGNEAVAKYGNAAKGATTIIEVAK